jgi:hypothetical protein
MLEDAEKKGLITPGKVIQCLSIWTIIIFFLWL